MSPKLHRKAVKRLFEVESYMKDYTVEKLRNMCFMSHGGAGKTMLAEAMLFNTGVLDRFSKVNDGTTTTDYDPEEIKILKVTNS